MNRSTLGIAIAALALLLATPSVAAERQVRDYSKQIEIFKRHELIEPHFLTAYGYAVFPTIGKGGFGIGVAHGRGQVYRRGEVIGFTSVTDISFGFQLGGQVFSQIVFFEDRRAFDDFTNGNFEFAAEVSAVAVTASVQAQASTTGATGSVNVSADAGEQMKTAYRKGMLVFVMGKGGLMYEAAIAGQKYTYRALE